MPANWFLGIPLSPGAWLAQLPSPPSGFRRFEAADVHLTVAFLGPVDEGLARAAWNAMDWPLAPIDVTLGDVAAMGPPVRYSALSALLEAGRERLEAAITAARPAAHAASGTRIDPRPAKAHLTLARPQRRATDVSRRQGLEWARALELPKTPFRLDEIALYTWSDDRAQTLFRIVERRPMGGG